MRTALVTGGNRGIGFEACRELAQAGMRVILTARNVESGREAAEKLASEDLEVWFEQMDVADPDSVTACAERLAADGVQVDVLVNNAGISHSAGVLELTEQELTEALSINLLGAWRTSVAFVPGMRERGWGRVVNVSSSLGQIGEKTPSPGAYGISKTALNAMTKQVAEAAGPSVKVNAVAPGWVATDMGGPDAPLTVQQGCDTLVWLATLDDDGPTGGFFRERQPIAW